MPIEALYSGAQGQSQWSVGQKANPPPCSGGRGAKHPVFDRTRHFKFQSDLDLRGCVADIPRCGSAVR